jgi:protein tyrosine/serine phosphatase
MAERAVSFTNVFNFRDLGGYRTTDGRTTRWQRLFRSDDLSRLGDDDRERFESLGIRTVVDLRRPHEIDADGRIPQLHDFSYHHIHLVHPQWPRATFADTGERASYVLERYREMSIEAGDGIGQALRLIADAEAAPLVFHCIAGKDRTGVVSALTLSLLGVPDDDIADDYELSEEAEPKVWAYLARNRPDMQGRVSQHITVNPRQGMLDFLADLRARHGSVAGYAAHVGVTLDHVSALRTHLLTT